MGSDYLPEPNVEAGAWLSGISRRFRVVLLLTQLGDFADYEPSMPFYVVGRSPLLVSGWLNGGG